MKEIESDLFFLGVNDRSSDLFEGQWPLPEGISYNSYLLRGDENVLIDTVDRGFTERWLRKLEDIISPEDLDYLVVNHLEPDHGGSIPVLRRINPELEIIGNDKTAEMLAKFYDITTGIRTVEKGETLQLGDHELSFIPVPFVHWPESMVTYDKNRKVLFSSDIFGTFGTVEGGIHHGQTAIDHSKNEMLRYFSNIVGAFTTPASQALEQLDDLEIELIAPAHGPLWKENKERAIELYKQWSAMEGEPGITIIYGTMYGNTEKMMEEVAAGVREAGVDNLEVIDSARKHPSFALSEAWRRQGLIIGAPTYGNGLFPPTYNLVHLLEKKKLQNRTAGLFGSHGWSGGGVKVLEKTAEKLDWSLPADSVKFNGKPGRDELRTGRKMGQNIAETVLNAKN